MNTSSRKWILFTASFVVTGVVILRFFESDTSSFQTVEKSIPDLELVVVHSNKENPDFFNNTLNRDDIAFTYGAKMTMLTRITTPRTMMGRGSIDALEEELGKLGSLPIDYIQYNPEQWQESHTPREEIADLLISIQKVRDMANEHGAKLSFITDHLLLDEYGERIAPLLDLFGIQLQRYQREGLEDFRAEALRKHSIVRRGSDTAPIFFQTSLAPPPLWEEKTLPDSLVFLS